MDRWLCRSHAATEENPNASAPGRRRLSGLQAAAAVDSPRKRGICNSGMPSRRIRRRGSRPGAGRPGSGRSRWSPGRISERAVRRAAAAGGDRASGGRTATGVDRRRTDREPRPRDGMAGDEASRAGFTLWDRRVDCNSQSGHRQANAASRRDPRRGPAGARPAGWTDGKTGVGGVLNAPFPPRRLLRNIVRNTFRHLFAGAARSWRRNLGTTAPALGSMTLLLLLSGVAGLSAFGLQGLAASQAAEAAVLHVYLRDDARQQDTDALRARLESDRRVLAVTYTSKADALKRAQHRPGLPELAGAADENPFPASLDVRVRSVQDVGALAASAADSPAVDPVLPTSYNPGAYQRIQTTLTVVAVAGGAFLLLLGFVAIAVTINSIQAAIQARRNEVSIMQLVGAARWMVRGPFLIEGAMTGSVAGLVAALVTLAGGLAGLAFGTSTFAQLAPGLTVSVCFIAAGIVLLAGVVLGSAASLVSVHRQMESA